MRDATFSSTLRQFANPRQGSASLRFCVGALTLPLLLSTNAAIAQTRTPSDSTGTASPASSAPSAEPGPAPAAGPDADAAGAVAIPPPPPGANLPAIDPIVPDQEFNQSVPSLDVADDPELAKPLETIEAFERRVAQQQAGATAAAAGKTPPSNAPATGEGIPHQEIGDAPITDAELAKPLPPLDQFQVEPVQLAAPEKDNAKTEVRYTVQINGLEAADKDTDTDLAAEFRGLSALRKGHGKAANGAMVAARLSEDGTLLKRVLASEGWYQATVTTRIDQAGAQGAEQGLTAVLEVAPGRRFSIGEIVITADPTIPPGLIQDNMALKADEPIVAARVQGAEAQIALALPQHGYPFAKVGQRDVLLDPDTAKGVYTLPVEVGPRGRFGGFATSGSLAFGVDHVATIARFKRGELYDSRKVDDLRKALVATGLFATVGVEAQRTGQDVGDGTQYVTMLVDQHAGPPRTIAATAGYGTGQGFTAEASWTNRNKFPPEGALIVHGIGGTQQQGAGVTFRRSNAGQRDRSFEVVVAALHSSYDAYSAFTGQISARLSRDSTPLWQKKFTWAVGGQLLGTVEKSYDFAAGARVSKTYYIAGLSGQAGLDFTDSLLDPTRGFRVTALIEPQGSVRGAFTPYVRARIDASGYYPVSDGFVLAGRVRVGTIQGAQLNDIAPSQRFYAGGGGSVRGFAYQRLGPLDPNGDPIGGRSLVEGAAEVRYRFGNYGVVGFVDAGQTYTSTTPRFSDIRYGVGIGGRFYTNFGPVRLDVATPLARRSGESRFNIYVSIGQAF